jgi:hypothetical protein
MEGSCTEVRDHETWAVAAAGHAAARARPKEERSREERVFIGIRNVFMFDT